MKVREILKDCARWTPSQDYSTVKPMVSVLLPTFRRAKSGLFEAAVQSVLHQDFKNLELIIIDDASTDGTADLIEHFMKTDPRVSWIRHSYNVGLPAISEYEGVAKARGEYIAFIFDDNVWERDYLERTIAYMVRNHAKAAYGCVHSYYGKDESQYIVLGKTDTVHGIHSIQALNYIPNSAVILAKEVLRDPRVGLYDPHVTMTRLCDWGLWKRLVKYYEFFETGILCGVEKGASLSDSLGNTYKMSPWCVAEREASVSSEELSFERYLDIEINVVPANCTELYEGAVNELYRNFNAKTWYREEKRVSTEKRHIPCRVLILSTGYDATIELSFGRLAGGGSNCIFNFGWSEIPLCELAQADAVVLVRNIVGLKKYKAICKKWQIPCYYYLDDNFIELYKENKKDGDLRLMSEELVPDKIRSFAGVITSTHTLRDYFLERKLHEKVYTLEPSIDGENIQQAEDSGSDERITLAYMGGPARDKTFCSIVMPAIAALANRYPLRVICIDRVKLDAYDEEKNLEIVKMEHSLSLDLILKRYGIYRPDILIHCGAEGVNNPYKTENALINAAQLGATLVASDLPPFSGETAAKEYCVCTKNTIQAWYDALQELINDTEKRIVICRRAQRYCLERYSRVKHLQVLRQVMEDVEPANNYKIIERLLNIEMQHGNSTTAQTPSKLSRSLTEVPLAFTGEVEGSRSYRVRCNVDIFSELGICFASYGDPVGHVYIEIWSDGGKLRESILDLTEFVHDDWTYVEFERIENAKGKIFTIVLRFEYEAGASRVGFFEDNTKKTFLYKLTNKLGHPIPVVDLLFADCR